VLQNFRARHSSADCNYPLVCSIVRPPKSGNAPETNLEMNDNEDMWQYCSCKSATSICSNIVLEKGFSELVGKRKVIHDSLEFPQVLELQKLRCNPVNIYSLLYLNSTRHESLSSAFFLLTKRSHRLYSYLQVLVCPGNIQKVMQEWSLSAKCRERKDLPRHEKYFFNVGTDEKYSSG
jgi:hypothetical protein